jgi:hypothetical protein
MTDHQTEAARPSTTDDTLAGVSMPVDTLEGVGGAHPSLLAEVPEDAESAPPDDWRQYRDQLTPEQIGILEQFAGSSGLPALARTFAADNRRQQEHAHVPAPEDAVSVGRWENLQAEWGTPEGPFRHWVGSSWIVPARHEQPLGWGVGHDDVQIRIEGIQLSDGRTTRYVTIAGDVSVLPPTSARLLSESLVYAHAELMSWASVAGRATGR